MKRLRTSLATVAAGAVAFALVGCGSSVDETGDSGSANSTQITVTHAQGETTLSTNPQKVVVLDYGVLDSLEALDITTVVGVPKGALPAFFDEYAADKYEDVGTLQEPDMEKIAEIDPDVIFIGGRSAAKYPELSEIAPTVDLTTDNANFIDSLKTNTAVIGEIFEKTDEVNAEIAEIDADIAEAKANASKAGKSLITLVSGGKLSAFGPGSRFGFIHDVLGVEPASPDLQVDQHGQAISFEFIAQVNPQTLYVIDRDAAIGEAGQSAQEVLNNDLVNSTDAGKNGDIVYLDGARWYLVGAGLDNVDEMIDEVTSVYDA